jgi:hypothetical protein
MLGLSRYNPDMRCNAMIDPKQLPTDSMNQEKLGHGESGTESTDSTYPWTQLLRRVIVLTSVLWGISTRPVGLGLMRRPSEKTSDTGSNEAVLYDLKLTSILEQLAVANLYFRDQVHQLRIILALCMGSAFPIIILQWFFPVFKAGAISLMVSQLALLGMVYIRLIITAYRISKGYFGNNRSEILRIISFINEKSDDIDSSGGGKVMLMYPQDYNTQEGQVRKGLEGLGA